MIFRHTVLANGLPVIGEVRDSAVSVALGFFVRTGARDETPELSGVSHFLEHMMFKGTATRSALDVNYQLGSLGAQANAYTSEENTVYYLAVLPEYLEPAFELLSDMLRPALDPIEFDLEKKVILEEIALYKDKPSHVLFETTLREHFHGHPAGNSVIGSAESVSGVSREMMKRYYDVRYTAPNIVLACAGNFDWDRFVELAEKYTGGWPNHEAGRERVQHSPTERTRDMTKENMQRAHVALVSPGPSATDPERYAADVLSTILGDSTGSRTSWELIDRGLADSAVVDADEMDGTGIIFAYASATPENLGRVEQVLRGILSSPRSFSDADLERAVTKLGTRLVLQGESSMRRLMAVGLDWIYRGDYAPLADELNRVRAVKRADIETLLERFPFAPKTTVRLLPA